MYLVYGTMKKWLQRTDDCYIDGGIKGSSNDSCEICFLIPTKKCYVLHLNGLARPLSF